MRVGEVWRSRQVCEVAERDAGAGGGGLAHAQAARRAARGGARHDCDEEILYTDRIYRDNTTANRRVYITKLKSKCQKARDLAGERPYAGKKPCAIACCRKVQ